MAYPPSQSLEAFLRTLLILRRFSILGDASCLYNLMGKPYVSIEEIVRWVAGWISNDGNTLGKPTKYESRSGEF